MDIHSMELRITIISEVSLTWIVLHILRSIQGDWNMEQDLSCAPSGRLWFEHGRQLLLDPSFKCTIGLVSIPMSGQQLDYLSHSGNAHGYFQICAVSVHVLPVRIDSIFKINLARVCIPSGDIFLSFSTLIKGCFRLISNAFLSVSYCCMTRMPPCWQSPLDFVMWVGGSCCSFFLWKNQPHRGAMDVMGRNRLLQGWMALRSRLQ